MDIHDIEQFALENLNEHRKGLLGKAVPMANMLTWSKVRRCCCECVCISFSYFVLFGSRSDYLPCIVLSYHEESD